MYIQEITVKVITHVFESMRKRRDKNESFIYIIYIKSQILVRFDLRLAVFNIFHTLGIPIDPHVNISKKCNN